MPKEFEFAHQFCFYLHDVLAGFILYGERNRLFDVRFELSALEHASELAELEGGEILDWLEKYEYDQVIGELLIKTLFPALLADFCHFVYEALECSQKGKLTVTYALLRKPLRENLLILEWLLADPEQFLKTFYDELPAAFEPKRNKALEIIELAAKRTFHANLFTSEFLYDLRYNANADFGLEPMWNKAVHLVTTRSQWATEPQNLNFIFSNDEDRWFQSLQIYTQIPLLLFHTVEVCESLLYLILKRPPPEYGANALHRMVGFLLWQHELISVPYNEVELSKWLQVIEESSFSCLHCSHPVPLTDTRILRSMFEKKVVKCPECGRKNSLVDLTTAGTDELI